MQASLPPSSYSAPPPVMPARSHVVIWVVAALGLLCGVAAAAAVVLVRHSAAPGSVAGRSVVRVVLTHQAGTGFFVAGPDSQAYIVTANHVVDTGEPILVERTVDGPSGTRWTGAY